MVNNTSKRLVADVGGTNTRIALFDPATQDLSNLQTYINRDFTQFEEVVAAWLAELREDAPPVCCIAIASALEGDQVDMVNMDWSFSRQRFARRFAFNQIAWLNDFEGNAHALTHLPAEDVEQLHAGRINDQATLAVIGPGTGLGGATRCCNGRVQRSEPGSMGLSPASALEIALFEQLLTEYDNIYSELLISGPGLYRLYDNLCRLAGQSPRAEDPAGVTELAATKKDAQAELALQVFCELLGSACGDFVLANGAYGGLYLAGGILPRISAFLHQSHFHQRFCDKGPMAGILEGVPVYLITGSRTGLIGAAYAPLPD